MGQVKSDRELMRAVLSGDLDLAQQLLDSGANVCAELADMAYPGGSTALHALCYASPLGIDRLVVGKFLVDNGVDVNAVNECGDTPLHIVECEIPFLKFLIGHGADVNLRNNNGHTALLKHCCGGSLASIRTLLKADFTDETIQEALGFVLQAPFKNINHAKIVLEFLERTGAGPDAEFDGKPILDYFDAESVAARNLIEEAQRQHRAVQMWESLSSAMGKGGDLSDSADSSSSPSM